MALLKIIRNEHNQIGLWSLEESPEELEQQFALSELDREQLERYTSRFRKREFLAVRKLLTELLGSYPEIKYDQLHRPFLSKSSLKISISHSRSLVAVILSERPAGIDTEETYRDITPIVGRFMTPAEIAWSSVHPDPEKARVLCWSIKESVFKLMGAENVDFRTMISIDPVEAVNPGKAYVTFTMSGESVEIAVDYLFEQNNVITWCEFPCPEREKEK